MTRRKALSKPPDPDWHPNIGDWVYVPAIEGTLANLTATGEVRVVCPPYARIALRAGKQKRNMVFRINDIRLVKSRQR